MLGDEIYQASEDFHAAKRRGEIDKHMRYRDLVAWLREWRWS